MMKWIILGISGLIAFIYSIFVSKYAKNDSPFVSWLTTLFSVVVAALIGIAIFFLQNDLADKSKQRRYFDLVKTELEANLRDLTNQDKNRLTVVRGNYTNKVLYVELQDFCLRTAIQSGLFNDVDTKNLYTLANGIHKHCESQKYFRALLHETSVNPENINTAARSVNELEKELVWLFEALEKVMTLEPAGRAYRRPADGPANAHP